MKFIVVFLLVPVAFACVVPESGLVISNNTVFCSGSYFLDEGIHVSGSDFVVRCEGTAILRGSMKNTGIAIDDAENVSVRDCQIMHFDTGVFARNSSKIVISNNRLLRNKNGLQISFVTNSTFINYDVSLSRALSVYASKNNWITSTNKRVVGGFCALNKCNNNPAPGVEKLLRFLLFQLSM